MSLPIVPEDKANHAIYGASICWLAQALVLAMTPSLLVAAISGLLVCILFAMGKELYDKEREERHTASWGDLLATVAGGAAASAFAWLLPVLAGR